MSVPRAEALTVWLGQTEQPFLPSPLHCRPQHPLLLVVFCFPNPNPLSLTPGVYEEFGGNLPIIGESWAGKHCANLGNPMWFPRLSWLLPSTPPCLSPAGWRR